MSLEKDLDVLVKKYGYADVCEAVDRLEVDDEEDEDDDADEDEDESDDEADE